LSPDRGESLNHDGKNTHNQVYTELYMFKFLILLTYENYKTWEMLQL